MGADSYCPQPPYIEPRNDRGCRAFKVRVLAKPDGGRPRTWEFEPMEKVDIELGMTGADWEPCVHTKWYAQRVGGKYAFGADATQALANLLAIEASDALVMRACS
jgi:hypothetical protein